MSMRVWQLLALIGILAAAGPARPQSRPAGYQLIVNPSNPLTSVDRAFLRQAFLKKTMRWSHGEPIRPVDLRPTSAVRRDFSEQVLGRSVAAVRAYWQQLIFSGREIPPLELEDSGAVVRYVARHRGTVGYVAGDVKLDGVKIVPLN
jgi:ABC-type phosphate transport system substrate-binding protein